GMGETLVVGGCRLSNAPVGHGTPQVHVCRGGGVTGSSRVTRVRGTALGQMGGDAACPRVTGPGGVLWVSPMEEPHGGPRRRATRTRCEYQRLDRTHHVAGVIGFQDYGSRVAVERLWIGWNWESLTENSEGNLIHAYEDIHTYSFRKNTIGAAGLNHLPVTEVLPQGNANAPRAFIRRVLAPTMVLYSVRLNNPILRNPPDAVILYCSLNSFLVAHSMADSDLCPPSVL
ncbi:hypothetical protein PIB30_076414, partial [Stylosanthes scabra]|nr:hypothetical protein [Stylosanthes scabra]